MAARITSAEGGPPPFSSLMKLIGPLTVEPQVVGDAILAAVEKKTDVVYVSGKWRLVMLIIKALPEAVFKKLKF